MLHDTKLALGINKAFYLYDTSMGIRESMARFQSQCKSKWKGFFPRNVRHFLKRNDRSMFFGDNGEILNKKDPIHTY